MSPQPAAPAPSKAAQPVPAGGRGLARLPPAQREALARHFGSPATAEAALLRRDLAAVAQAPGFTPKKAIEAVRAASGLDEADAFFATAPARRLRDELLERLASFAATAHGRSRLQLLSPLPDPESCVEHAAHVMAHKAAVAALDRERVRRLLRRVHACREPAPRAVPDRMVVCESEAVEERWRKAGLAAWCRVGGQNDLRLAQEAELVVALYEDGFDLADLEAVAEVPAAAPWSDVCPEAVVAWFTANREVLSACADLGTLLGKPHKSGEGLQLLEETQRSRLTPATLRTAVEEVRRLLDAKLRERVQGLQVSGTDLLDLMGKRLPGPLQAAMAEVLAEGRAMLAERTGHSFQPFSAGFPVAVDEAEVERVESRLAGQGRLQEFQALAKTARRLSALRPAIEAEVAAWLAFDADFALGCFALHYGLRPARFGDRLEVSGSVHLDLADRPEAQRIAYHIGGDGREQVALLTGANSGGKTTLLEHLGQTAILARLGLPVVGDATVPWVEELHYVTARRSLDAGAFEGFLRSFLPIVQGDRPRLVLADEVEAVTEMQAAGRVLGFFLDRLASGPSLGVVVSHMAPHILEHCADRARIRVDGIEASGLDAQHRLVVERQPRIGHLARSTPELIVARLAATTRGREQGLYRDLLEAFARASPGASVPAGVPAASATVARRPRAPSAEGVAAAAPRPGKASKPRPVSATA